MDISKNSTLLEYQIPGQAAKSLGIKLFKTFNNPGISFKFGKFPGFQFCENSGTFWHPYIKVNKE